MSNYWSMLVKGLKPYVPGEQPVDRKYIKLNTNENPYPPAPSVLAAASAAASGETLKLYPEPTSRALRQAIASYHGLQSWEQVFVGNGSDELLAFAFMAFFDPEGAPVVFPEITYSFYPVYCGLFKIPFETIPLDDDFNILWKQLLPDQFLPDQRGGILIANPNAPTGVCLPADVVEKIVAANQACVFVVDEAYIDFGGTSVIDLIDKYPNLLAVRSLSKSRSLAGLRIGYAAGSRELIQALDMVKNSFNSYTIDRVAAAAALASFAEEDYFQTTCSKIIETREKVVEDLLSIGFKVLPSKANFIFISHPEMEGEFLFNHLKEAGVLVRYFRQPRISCYLRVSIGSFEEMKVFLVETKKALKKHKESTQKA